MSKISKFNVTWEESDSDFSDDFAVEKKSEVTDFEALLGQEDVAKEQRLSVGSKVTAIISSISETSDDVIVELGIKSTAIIAKNELTNAEGVLTSKVGDEIEAFIVSRKQGEILLSKSLSQSAAAADDLKNAFMNQIPIKGRVAVENKGGFDVQIFGKSAFCPVSQIDLHFVENKNEYIGKEFLFIVTKFEGPRNIVVSRSALLVKELESKIEDLKQHLVDQSILGAEVVDLKPFGIIVRAAGVEGLVHISELSHGRVELPSDLFKKGDKTFVKVLKIDEEKGRPKISFSIKKAGVDPWDRISDLFKVGEKYEGRVARLENFGAFVELTPGIDGLIHVSEMVWERRVKHPSDILTLGDRVSCIIKSIDPIKKQVALSLKDIKDDPWYEVTKKFNPQDIVKGQVERLKDFGAIIRLDGGITGMLPVSVMKRAEGESYRKRFSPPQEVEVKIVNLDVENKKVLLTLPNIEEDSSDQSDYIAYQKAQIDSAAESIAHAKENSSASVGNFGAILQAKLNKNNL